MMIDHATEPKPVWGAKAIGEVIGKNPRQTFWLLQNGMLPSRKVGARWVSDRATLKAFLRSDIGVSLAA